jgi:hypothetical protein
VFRSEASEHHGGGGGADHSSLLVSASSEQTEARVFPACARRAKIFRTLFQNFEHSDHLLVRPSKFSQIDSLVVTTKTTLCFRCDLQILSIAFCLCKGLPYCFIGSELSSQLDVTFGTCFA